MSTRIRTLHEDSSGVASVEFILAIPVFLILTLVIMDLGRYRTAVLHTTIAARNAAWAEAQGGDCRALDDLPEFVGASSTITMDGCSSAEEPAIGSNFWEQLERAGREGLTGSVSGTPAPSLVEGRAELQFDPADWPGMTIAPRTFAFSLFTHETFHDADEFDVGYEREMRARLSTGTGRLMSLFPNVFPAAQ
jgi:hypothetical protein